MASEVGLKPNGLASEVGLKPNGLAFLEYILNSKLNLSDTQWIAELLSSKLKDQIVYSPINASYSSWFIFENHRWHEYSPSVTSYIYPILDKLSSELSNLIMTTDTQDLPLSKAKEIHQLTTKLKFTSFRHKIINELSKLVRNEKFRSILNFSAHLICFTNGVFDFSCKKFRDGQPTDYLTICTGYSYKPYDDYPVDIRNQLMAYLQSILPNTADFEAMLDILVLVISGSPILVRCVLCGGGDNGKSTFLHFIRLVLGGYLETVSGYILFSQQKYYRLIIISDSYEADIKRSRLLTSQVTHSILESNTYICDPSIRTIPFMSKFVKPESPTEHQTHYLPADPDINSKLEILVPVFGSMLIDRFIRR